MFAAAAADFSKSDSDVLYNNWHLAPQCYFES